MFSGKTYSLRWKTRKRHDLMHEAKDLDSCYDPGRFVRVADRHRKALAWEPQGYIPLGIHVVDPRHACGINYSEWLDPRALFNMQVQVLKDSLAVASDLLPAIGLNHLGDAVLTSLFGARQFMPSVASATLQDVGPTPLPVFADIREVADYPMPQIDGGIVPRVERFALFYRQHLPEWVHVVAPMPSGPFSTAMELRGSEFLVDLADHPELCRRLINMCARLQVQVEMKVRACAGAPVSEHVTNFGILGAGLRLGEDSIVDVSPGIIRQFGLPAIAVVNQLCGGCGHIHFCSLPHSRFEHIYPVLADASDVAVVSSQFGFEFYERHLDELRGRLGVEAFYGDALAYVKQKYGGFRQWADEFVPSFKNESGLVLYCQVESVEVGQELWAIWNEAHRK